MSFPVVGYRWRAPGGAVYLCDSHDPSCGYWMTNVADPADRRNISERAIGRTFHRVWDAETVLDVEAPDSH